MKIPNLTQAGQVLGSKWDCLSPHLLASFFAVENKDGTWRRSESDLATVVAQLTEANFAAGLVIQEVMQTKPGKQDDYIRELEWLYVPWSERTGKRWLGSFITTFRLNEVIHYWALDGEWDCFENHYPSWKDSPPAEIVTWMSVAPALRDGWEDSILQALPPSPLR